MRIWALSDLHLSLGVDKPMDIFGDHWAAHHETMAISWDELVADDDIMITPGDFSWGTKAHEVKADFSWLAKRPGHKILVKGNHDHWWPKTKSKLAALLPEKTYALKKNACLINGAGFYGARGGDFQPLKQYGDKRSQEDIDAALEREERELALSWEQLQELSKPTEREITICLFHYPPLPAHHEREDSDLRFVPHINHASHCVYGHLHGAEARHRAFNGEFQETHYHCTSCDLLDFKPKLIWDSEAT